MIEKRTGKRADTIDKESDKWVKKSKKGERGLLAEAMDILVLGRRGGCGAIAYCIDTSITTAFCYIVFARVGFSGFMRCHFSFSFAICIWWRSGKGCMKEAQILCYFLGFGGLEG